MAKIFVTGSIYLTVAISVERYVTVCYPFFRFLLFLILICLLFHSDFPHCATLSSGFFSCSNPIQVTNSFRVSRAHLSAWCIVGTYNFLSQSFYNFLVFNFFCSPFLYNILVYLFLQKCLVQLFLYIFLYKFFKLLNYTTDQVSLLHFLFFTIFQSSSSFRVTR